MSSYTTLQIEFEYWDFEIEDVLEIMKDEGLADPDERRQKRSANERQGRYVNIFCKSMGTVEEEVEGLVERLSKEISPVERLIYYDYEDTGMTGRAELLENGEDGLSVVDVYVANPEEESIVRKGDEIEIVSQDDDFAHKNILDHDERSIKRKGDEKEIEPQDEAFVRKDAGNILRDYFEVKHNFPFRDLPFNR